MALFKGDVLIAGTNPSGGGGAGGGHVIQDSTGEEFEQRPALQFIGADVVDDDVNEATQVITPSFREIQGDIPDTNLVCLDGIPIGGIIPYGAPIDTLSQDWLPCLGQAVSRTFYHELFVKYGTTYGSGDGSTTFNLPNYGGRVPVGLDENDTDFDTLGETLGEKKHTLTISEIPSHYHDLTVHSGGNTAAPIGGVANTANATGNGLLTNSSFRIQNTGGGQSHNNIQPSVVANYIVKAKTSSHTITTSNVMTVHNESDENTYSTNYINDKFSGIELKDLWTGTSSLFTQQTISLDLKDYDLILVDFKNYSGSTEHHIEIAYQRNVWYDCTHTFIYNNSYFRGQRSFYFSDTGVYFSSAWNAQHSTDNNWYLPTKIIGIKLH